MRCRTINAGSHRRSETLVDIAALHSSDSETGALRADDSRSAPTVKPTRPGPIERTGDGRRRQAPRSLVVEERKVERLHQPTHLVTRPHVAALKLR